MKRLTEKQKIDAAVDEFCAAMKERMHEQRRHGFKGWDGAWPQKDIQERLLRNSMTAVANSDTESMVDAANLAMMLRHRALKQETR